MRRTGRTTRRPIVTVTAPDRPVRLVLALPGGSSQEFTLAKAAIVLGRATTSDVVLRDWAVSRSHARIDRTARGYEVTDLESVNGTFVNGVRTSDAVLAPGDELRLGNSVFRFDPSPTAAAAEATRVQMLPAAAADAEQTQAAAPLPVRLEEVALPRLAVHTDERTWEVTLAGDSLTIGRDADNDLVLELPAVSRHHALLERRGNAFLIRDLGSSNGTWVGGERVQRRSLDDGESVRIGAAQIVFKRGVSQDTLIDEELGAATRRPVVVIPGFAGSNLWLGRERVWPTLRMHELPAALQMQHRLEARGILDEVVIVPNLVRLDQYGVLTGYLRESLGYEAGKDLLEFAYDFRQDNRLTARQLGAAIEQWGANAPVTIIAHSMGCLIARYYIERLGGARRVERVIMIGGPHAGTPYAFASLLKGPDLLPLGMMNLRLRDVIATFPSWYQILPAYKCLSDRAASIDVWSDESWLAAEYRPLLRDARAFRQELGMRCSVPAVCIFGYGVQTITGAVLQRTAQGEFADAAFVQSDQGDGTIPERSAVLKHAEIHPVRQHHGSLYTDNDVKMRLKIELTRR
jgi:pSer/pThr/pTyr-binding forkhead associated (FHA) protein